MHLWFLISGSSSTGQSLSDCHPCSHLTPACSNPALKARLAAVIGSINRADKLDAAYTYAVVVSPLLLLCGVRLDSKTLNQAAWYEVRGMALQAIGNS